MQKAVLAVSGFVVGCILATAVCWAVIPRTTVVEEVIEMSENDRNLYRNYLRAVDEEEVRLEKIKQERIAAEATYQRRLEDTQRTLGMPVD